MHKNSMLNYIWIQQKLWHHYKKIEKRGYPKKLINEQIDKVKNMKRKQLLSTNKRTIQNPMWVLIIYNRSRLNISYIITKNWSIWQISPSLQKVFHKPVITYKRNKSSQAYWRSHSTRRKSLQDSSLNNKQINPLCTQLVNTKNFKSYQTNKTLKIFHKLNYKSSFVVYLMQCTICKIQDVGKEEIPFNIWLKKQRKDANGSYPCIHTFQTNWLQLQQTCKIHSFETN